MSRWTNEQLAQALADNPDLRLSSQNRPLADRKAGSGKATNGQSEPVLASVGLKQPLTFTVPGSPIPKPRQTRRDKWAKRPCVLRYRAWADTARIVENRVKREAFPNVRFLGTIRYGRIQAVAFFKMPSIWNPATKAKMRGQPHCLRPDADNLLKAIADALYPTGDEHLYDLQITKRWDDGNGPRTVITLW